jgi:alkylation response protein AidB-like acyl-CoA dehydrogenase
MDFGLNETQELLRRTLREFLQREYPSRVVREAEASERGYLPAVYRRLGELGVLGLTLPEAEGGAGGSWVDLAVFYEEAGRALLASPHLSSVVLGGGLLARWASPAQRQAWLPALASGERVLAVAWPLDAGAPGPSGLVAQPAAGGYRLRGEVPHVAHYVGADAVLLVAAIADTAGRLGLFLADPATPGLTATPQPLQSGEPLVRLRCDDLWLPADAAVGEPQPAAVLFGPTLDAAKMAVAALALGGAEAAVDMAVAYAKERHQFGRPIGSFQAIQHRLARLAMLVEEARLLVYAAAWQLDQGAEARRAAAMAKLQAGTAFREAATGCILVHGGYGFMLETDPQLYYRRAKVLEFALGAPEAQRALIAATHTPFIPA